MKDYSNLGLDNNLQKISSLASKRRGAVSSHKFDVNYQVPTGGLSYSQLNVDSRPYTTIVTLSKKQGTFDNIKDAVEYVNKVGGGRILIMPGTYLIDYDITLYDDISIEGLSERDTILDFNSGTNYISAVGTDGSEKRSIILKNMTIKNNHNTTNGTLYFEKVIGLNIENITFIDNRTGSSGYDIYLNGGCSTVEIKNNTAEGGATFVRGLTDRNNVISENYISGYNNYVIWGTESGTGLEQVNIEKNRFSNNTKGILYGYVYFSHMTNNFATGDIDSGSSLVVITTGSGNFFTSNYFTANRTVMNISSSGTKFSNNQLGGSGTETVVILSSIQNLFSSNEINNTNAVSGQAITISNNGNSFSGNQIRSTADTAVKITAGASNSFSGNELAGGAYGADIDSGVARTVIVGNNLYGATADTRDNGSASVIASNGT